jgi:hypothetical protein
MRRLTQIALILMMVICLVACSGANESQDVSGTEDRQDTDNSVAHSDEAKATVSCSMVIRAMGSQGDLTVPTGATQGSASALGYSQSWTFGNGATGELYLSRTEKRLLGVGNRIGSYSPVQELAT